MKQIIISFFISILKRSARSYLAKVKPMIIGVTGSVGKTSCRLLIHDTLKELLPQEYIYTSPKNYNSDLGLCLSILGISSYKPTVDGLLNALFEGLYQALFPHTKPSILVLEYGIDKPGDMDVLLSIATPDISILTSVDLVHGENFLNGIQSIYDEKVKLLYATKDTVFINSQVNSQFSTLSSEILKGKTTIEFSENENEGQILFSDYKISLSGDKIIASYIYSSGGNNLTITTNTTGKHNIAYQSIGITIADIISHRKQYPSFWNLQALQLSTELQPGRFTLFTSEEGDIIIDSSYNASPSSMRKVVLQGLEIKQQFFSDYIVICVLGEMRELGAESNSEHESLGQRLSDKVDNVIGVSGNSVFMTDYLIGLHDSKKHIFWVQTNLEVSDIVRQIRDDIKQESGVDKNVMIIFKSSQGEIRLEEAIKPFIKEEFWLKLPRQEQYWLEKKQFAKKLYIPHL